MRTAAVMLTVGLLWPAAARAFDPFSVILPEVREGNQLYQDQHFDQALEKYESAEQQINKEPRIHFNRGDALFKLGRAKEAREAFLRATGTADPELKKRNYYNIGNTFMSEGAFPDAISYYRRALEIDPQFDDARFNLELALRAIQQQKQNQNQDQEKQDQEKQDKEKQDQEKQDQEKQDQEKQDKEKQDQEKQDQEKQDQEKQDQEKQDQEKQDQEKQDQEKQDQEKQDKEKQDQEKQDQQKQDQEKQEQQKQQDASGQKPRQEPGRLSPAQVRDLLDAMRENEKPFQMDRFMMPNFKRKQVEKDW